MKKRLRYFTFVCLIIFGSNIESALSQPRLENSKCGTSVLAAPSKWGKKGRHLVERVTARNPMFSLREVTVFKPKNVSGPKPVIFFSHGFSGTQWKRAYPELGNYFASWGYVLVYSPYPSISNNKRRYNILWKGFEAAVSKYGSEMDLSRVGFVGHSYGGGATPAMANRGFNQKKWGTRAAYMAILAPWYSYEANNRVLGSFPKHVRTLIQVYQDDDVNDPNMAIDLFKNIRLSDGQLTYVRVDTRRVRNCEIKADHSSPARNPQLRLKQYAVFSLLHLLSEAELKGNRTAKVEYRKNRQINPGPYQPLVWLRNPFDDKPLDYTWDFDNLKNPRR